jgi:ATP/maltotriose-dependent transcriptional regulator MalT/two-component SAPR family response regulator
MAKLDPVLRHAITPPAFEKSKVHRERLVDSIHANVPRKLIVIAAPAGYGKTTLLADFTAHTDLPVCWVRLTEADRDVVRFTDVLALSLQRRFRRLQNALNLERLSGSSPEALARAFIELIDTHVSETFVIVLDDVHLINESKATLDFLDAFLEELPDQVTLIGVGREVLEVSLARLMAESDLMGLGPQDLALTLDEVIELAQSRSGMELSDHAAEQLHEETRGWITGVLLSNEISGIIPLRIAPTARPMVYEYLASVVLNRQPDHLRRFMLDTSVFPVMSVEGCDFLLKRDDSGRFLRELVRGGTFVTASDEGQRTFEYHPQFREFLLETLGSADRKQYKSLLSRAADYLAQHESPEHAIDLYCDAGAGRKAAALADKRAPEMYRRGRWRTLEAWKRRLEQVEAPAPKVFLYLAAYYSNQGNVEDASNALDRARKLLKPGAAKAVRAYAEIVQGFIAVRQRSFEAVVDAVEKAEAILGKVGSRQRRADCFRLRALESEHSGDLQGAEIFSAKAVSILELTDQKYALANALVDHSNIQDALGKSHESHATSLRAHELFNEVGSALTLAVSSNNLAYDAHKLGNYEQALELYNQALKFARQAASPHWEATILFGQADLFADLDLALQAAELYGQSLNLVNRIDNVDYIRYGCVRTSVLHRRRGGSGLAHEWLRRAMTLEEVNPQPVDIVVQLATLEIPVRPDHARETLLKLLEEEGQTDVQQRTLIEYYLSRSELAIGDLERTRVALESALDWAGANGTEQIIASEMSFDAEIRDFARRRLSGHPVLSIVLRRIETMRAVAQQYQDVPGEVDEGLRIICSALGDATVQRSDHQFTELKPLAREVFFYLIDHQKVDRDVLLENFWPHHPPGRQVANLHTAVYSLRRGFGKESILFEGTIYSLNPEFPFEYDVFRFEHAAAIAEGLPPGDPRRMFALFEAISSYGGAFLPEFTSEWVFERRRALEVHYTELLALHAVEALVRDEPLRAINTLRQALKIDPYRGDINLHYLEALGRLGRRSEIVAHYQNIVHLYRDDLGLDPPKDIRDLYASLIN